MTNRRRYDAQLAECDKAWDRHYEYLQWLQAFYDLFRSVYGSEFKSMYGFPRH